MGILTWIVLGLVAGFLAKFLMPGLGPGGLVLTILHGPGRTPDPRVRIPRGTPSKPVFRGGPCGVERRAVPR